MVGKEVIKGFFTECQLKNVKGMIKLYGIYFATTNIIMDTSKDHQQILIPLGEKLLLNRIFT